MVCLSEMEILLLDTEIHISLWEWEIILFLAICMS